jgi:hypothetical protein
MSYVGNVPTTAAFPFDQFSGNGSTTAFTLSYAPAGSTSIIVSISGVVQNPNTYSVSGTTLTFTPAPPTGTSNIAVLYLGLPVVATLTPGNTAYFSSSVFTATASQTVFTPSGTYQVGFINVIRNGSQLAPADYTATNGTTVTLASPCTAGDTVVIEVFNLTSLTGALPLTGGTVTGATTFNSTVQINGANVSGFTGFKNRIINPGMVIDQRNAGASITVNNTNLNYSVDRWWGTGKTSDGVYTMQRSASTPPTGFSNFLRVTVTTADASIAAGDTYYMGTKIEGFNVADLSFGSANAQTITISFWARSSVTGTFSGALLNGAENRSYPFTFAINTANTWEYETITIVGDTTGTWATDNSAGMVLALDLGSGSNFRAAAGSWVAAGEYGATGAVTLISTLNATFDITGVQLERGSNATSFEFRDYGRELILCQRYYEKSYNVDVVPGTATTAGAILFQVSSATQTCFNSQRPFAVQKRATPTITYYNPNSGAINSIRDASASSDFSVLGNFHIGASSTGAVATNSNVTANNQYQAHYTASIEL